LSSSYYQKKDFLLHCERYNKCCQEYYQLFKNNKLVSGAISYKIPINILTFSRFSWNINTKVIGVPASVSCSGLIGKDPQNLLIANIKKKDKFILGLNVNDKSIIKNEISGETLPTVVFYNKFSSIDDYVGKLRSSYRRRMRKIKSKLIGVEVKTLKCDHFTQKMYRLYLNVYENSKAKLEKLSHDFFKNLPKRFALTTFTVKGETVAWHITFKDRDMFYFFLGGLNYQYNKKYSLYFNLLFNILELGIERKCEKLDFGQTAEEPKTYLGGIIEERYMFAFHKNNFIDSILKKFKKRLTYKYRRPNVRVFKDDVI